MVTSEKSKATRRHIQRAALMISIVAFLAAMLFGSIAEHLTRGPGDSLDSVLPDGTSVTAIEWYSYWALFAVAVLGLIITIVIDVIGFVSRTATRK